MRNGMFYVGDKLFVDQEWIDAWDANEKPRYYKCKMTNNGWCYKYYKPSIAKLLMKRGAYLQMIEM